LKHFLRYNVFGIKKFVFKRNRGLNPVLREREFFGGGGKIAGRLSSHIYPSPRFWLGTPLPKISVSGGTMQIRGCFDLREPDTCPEEKLVRPVVKYYYENGKCHEYVRSEFCNVPTRNSFKSHEECHAKCIQPLIQDRKELEFWQNLQKGRGV